MVTFKHCESGGVEDDDDISQRFAFFSLERISGPRKSEQRNAINRGIKIDGFEEKKASQTRRLLYQLCTSTQYPMTMGIEKEKKVSQLLHASPFFSTFFLFPGRSHKRKLSEGKEVLSKKSILSASKPTELPAAADHYCITVGLF